MLWAKFKDSAINNASERNIALTMKNIGEGD